MVLRRLPLLPQSSKGLTNNGKINLGPEGVTTSPLSGIITLFVCLVASGMVRASGIRSPVSIVLISAFIAGTGPPSSGNRISRPLKRGFLTPELFQRVLSM